MAEENLSALLDGECSAEDLDRLLARMERSPGLKQSFSRLCLTREAAAGTRIERNQPCICDDVMSRLDAEPQPVSDRVVDLDERRRPRRWAWKPAAGLAAAAAMGALAVLVTLPEARQSTPASAGVASFVPQATTPVALPLPSISRPRHLQQVAAQTEAEDDLSNYLIEHSNTVAGRGMGGTLSYARFAAHNAVYRPETEEQR